MQINGLWKNSVFFFLSQNFEKLLDQAVERAMRFIHIKSMNKNEDNQLNCYFIEDATNLVQKSFSSDLPKLLLSHGDLPRQFSPPRVRNYAMFSSLKREGCETTEGICLSVLSCRSSSQINERFFFNRDLQWIFISAV